MKIKLFKLFVSFLAIVITITSVTSLFESNVNANNTNEKTLTQKDLNRNKLNNGNEIELNDKTLNNSQPNLQLVKEDIDLKANIQYDTYSDTMHVTGSFVDDNGSYINKNYNVLINQLKDDEFEAIFEDVNTGEVIKYNSLHAKSSAWPLIIIAAVARYGIKYAIKKYGKKATQNAVKTKSYGKVLPSISRLDANKRRHILASKHNWHKVTKADWNNVSKVMSHVMRHGKEQSHKGVRQKVLNMNGRTVVVTFVRKNGQIKVSNGWVR
ncbi:SAR2788 family putative toxin [Staphylococcus hyicus]|uniref:SAR2788 family putative toxin n=1 Tax=Staphylococcus hyicus TaxID=1284 RepID=UPI0027386B1C|nr:SAR2788 family putative toxin [Staphylococcus hyicus]MDP4448308.1 SAR2788 family putative toxin [Staphylococcus hyicus]MDP4459776.1 SAR2788 family putative toxin [Staphylococcus hyicus]MDP4468658.1 SAR2788 family putative toxin [Staphylococcus hyicus]MDY3698806.1 SAR2788 family putative toxin [Staphylococcus hyicus]